MNCELSLRLQTCLDALQPLQTIADIGTDHAYLPCAGVLKGQFKKAIAADVGIGPLEAAKTTISKYQLESMIEPRLELDVKLSQSFQRLVLQPNLDANILRTFLMKNQFEIIDEKIVYDEKKFYEVIVARWTREPIHYNELDIEFGPILRRLPSCDVFQEKWQKEFNKNEEIIKQLPINHHRIKTLNNRQSLLKEVLKNES